MLKPMMDKNWDRHKSIVNGHHMKDVQQKMDSEYKAHLRHQERVRENTERLRERQAVSQRTSNFLNINSARSYSKPWLSGMTTKREIPAVSGLEERQNRERQYKSTVSKLPAIKNDKDIIRKKTVYNPSTAHQEHKLITVSQPRITVEKKRLHVHQLSARPNVTPAARDTAKSKNVLKWQTKEPKRPAKQQKQTLQGQKVTNEAINNLNSIQHPNEEQKIVLSDQVDHHDPASSLSLNSHEIQEEPQITGRSSASSWSHFQEPEDRETEGNANEEEDTFDEDDLSYVSDCSDSTEEDILDTNNVGDLSTRIQERVNNELSYATSHNLNIISSFYGSLQTSRSLQSPTGTEVGDQSPNSPRNLNDTIEVPRMSALTAQSQIPGTGPNTNMQNHASPQTTVRDPGDREIDTLSSEHATVPSAAAPLRLRMSSTAPNITLLRENLDLALQTISMQRQSERRFLETSAPTLLNKEAEKPKTDPEKLKKLQESLLEEDSEEDGDLCRICLMGGETTENSLIAPCQCSGSLKYVHSECLKKWLLAKIKSGAELNTVKTCEMCKQTVDCEIKGFNLSEHYRKHQETQATLNPSLYLVLLLHLYQQRYEELLQLSNTRDRVSELSRRFLHLNLGRREHSRDNEQDA
ncbi:probable E3 ubiquitin-protein ligase MARCHF10 [Dendropsophus ebraccatus]|uniref:probable E3 ubiquitin-protein ligase MARCHF10 n=1 Tax=Dendropsophus ebraccatus TaxID=150705 RepID=UPI00383199AF